MKENFLDKATKATIEAIYETESVYREPGDLSLLWYSDVPGSHVAAFSVGAGMELLYLCLYDDRTDVFSVLSYGRVGKMERGSDSASETFANVTIQRPSQPGSHAGHEDSRKEA